MNPEVTVAVVAGVASVLVALLTSGLLVKLLMRKRDRYLADAQIAVAEAEAQTKLADQRIKEVEVYSKTAERQMRRVEQLHVARLEDQEELSILKIQFAETIQKLAKNELSLRRTEDELKTTRAELHEVYDSQREDRKEQERLKKTIQEIKERSQQCEEDRASLEAELAVLKQRLESFAVRREGGDDAGERQAVAAEG